MKRRILCISIIACMALGGCASQTASTSDSLRSESESTSLVEESEPASEPSEVVGDSSAASDELPVSSADGSKEESSNVSDEPSEASEASKEESIIPDESETASQEESNPEESSQPAPESKPAEQSVLQESKEGSKPEKPVSAPGSVPAQKPKEVQSVSLSRTELTMTVGQRYDLDVYFSPADAEKRDYVWEWTDADLAYVNGDGVIYAKAAGSVVVTARTYNGKSASCNVTIKEKPAPPQVSEASKPAGTSEPSETDGGKPSADIVNYNIPYTSDRVYSDLDRLCEKYSGILTRTSIGSSEKGKDIPCITIGEGKKEALIVGGIHSREHITISFVMRSLEAMAKAYKKDRLYGEYNVRELLEKYTLYIVPMCNPDGTDISTAGDTPLVNVGYYSHDKYKANANGVNLNRNFPLFWEERFKNQTTSPGDEIYAGKKAASEKETQALIALCEAHSFEWLLDMHIVGGGIFWCDSTSGRVPDDKKLAYAIGGRCNLAEYPMTTYAVNGGFENWFRYAFKRPGLCIELVPHSQSSRVSTYSGLNSIFDDAVGWKRTKYIFLEAMRAI